MSAFSATPTFTKPVGFVVSHQGSFMMSHMRFLDPASVASWARWERWLVMRRFSMVMCLDVAPW